MHTHPLSSRLPAPTAAPRQADLPADKLLRCGPDALSNAELLAVLIRTGTAGRPALDVAEHALTEAGGLRELLERPPAALRTLPGFGPARSAQLAACMALYARYLEARLVSRPLLGSPADVRRLLLARLRPYAHEVFAALFMDARFRLLGFEELFRGTVNGAAVYPREVARRCLTLNASAIIVAHNHPSGLCEPSAADRGITEQLRAALNLVDVRLIDHLVVGDGEVASFAERGWL